MPRGNILTEEEIARLAALPEKQRDYAVKIYAAREKKKSLSLIHILHLIPWLRQDLLLRSKVNTLKPASG